MLKKKVIFSNKTADYISNAKNSTTENRSDFVGVAKNNLINLRVWKGGHQCRHWKKYKRLMKNQEDELIPIC